MGIRNIVIGVIGTLLVLGVTQKWFVGAVMRAGKALSWLMPYRNSVYAMTDAQGRRQMARVFVVCAGIVLLLGSFLTALD